MVEKDRIESEQTEQNTLTCLQNALNETQETIRAYDVKAEILGVLLTLTIGIINYNFISDSNAFSVRIFALAASLTGLIAVGLVGFVLYPMRNPKRDLDISDFDHKGTYFVLLSDNSPYRKISTFAAKARQTDWIAELSFELLKSSKIRDRKHKWFVHGLKVSGLTLLLSAMLLVIAGISLCPQ